MNLTIDFAPEFDYIIVNFRNQQKKVGNMFISFDGIDGCGKTTQISLIKEYLVNQGYRVKVTKDPGDNLISEQIRNIILDVNNHNMCDETELLLFLAARRQNYEVNIKPYLNDYIILTDRYFLSTIIYQFIGKDLILKYSLEELTFLINLSVGIYPDISFIFNISMDTFILRNKQKVLDRIEKLGSEFYTKLIHGFSIVQKYVIKPTTPICIDANKDIHQVTQEIITNLSQFNSSLSPYKNTL